MKVIQNFFRDVARGDVNKLPVIHSGIPTQGPPRPFYALGVIRDGSDIFLAYRDSGTGKNYIERVVRSGDTAFDMPLLEYIEDDELWRSLFNLAIKENMLPNDLEMI